jgi:ribosomal protein S27AE
MKDDLTRRDFLKAAGLGVAGVVGASVLSRSVQAQEQTEDEKKKDDEKQDENQNVVESNDSAEEETRACPQCGALMYRQGRTWTCESCGYSYVE